MLRQVFEHDTLREKVTRKVTAGLLETLQQASGRIPVAMNSPWARPLASTAMGRKAKISCANDRMPSIPIASEMLVTLRRRSCKAAGLDDQVYGRRKLRSQRTYRQLETGHADHGFQARQGVARRIGVDSGHRAFMAGVHGLDHVEVSAPRHSPMMIQSGRIRLAFCRSVAVTAPRPSMLQGRVSKRTTWSCCN